MPGPGAYWYGEEEKDAVMEVMESGYLFRYGSENDPKFLHKVSTLESEFASYCGANHALATSSGTSSLLVSLIALDLKPGDEVIVPAYTFVATYSTCIFAGLVPVLTEIDESLSMDPEDIEHRITPRTKAIIPVHMLGNPCNMDRIMEIARKHNLKVLEDSCQATGASYKGRKVGTIGDIGAFSLNVFKTINSGDGGLVVTNDQKLYETAFGVHDQGHKPNRFGVEVGARSVLGLNFRMNEITGAAGLAQLRKLDQIVAVLREKKNKLKSLISGAEGFKFRVLNDPEGDAATLCTIVFDTRELAVKVSKALGSKTIDQSGWHVYANMEHVLGHLKEVGQPHTKGSYPKTDDILSRSMNISIGVVDGGLGAGWGININSTDAEIEAAAKQFTEVCK
ncbi:pleiotropic regulatory protein [Aquipluma nitroreducens]|uniref:Pleiotropic regulatory protein n=1 Tax=Aquipluma nitroreducens TaxID=2010828 RepID=A0A5K7S3K5_9BACT|nr:DegT/DnrJ/EryC1/StrS family aminotransferase [Aquipluma nitroreducens]BBE16151.1 pleiotropic regulatory protein [Aquipluma nitroreducens]